jgi:hypothetical protein
MQEDNPFIIEEPRMDENIGSIETRSETTEEPSVDALNLSAEENDTAGYRAVPEMAPSICAQNAGTGAAERIDLILAFIIAIAVLRFGRKGFLRRWIARTNEAAEYYPWAANILACALLYYMFKAPQEFGVAARGQIGVFGTLLFLIGIALAAAGLAFAAVVIQKSHAIFLRPGGTKIEGLNWLKYGLSLFAATAVLFLLLTESEIAFWAAGSTSFALAYAIFAERPLEALAARSRRQLAAAGGVIAICAILSGSAALLVLGALAVAKYLKEA